MRELGGRLLCQLFLICCLRHSDVYKETKVEILSFEREVTKPKNYFCNGHGSGGTKTLNLS